MIPISQDSIRAWCSGGSALANGQSLAAKGQLYDLRGDADQTLIWGLCRGSGAKPYAVSADFGEDPQKPVFRCSCPSKQFPCKHAVGLLFTWLAAPEGFVVAEVPEEIATKRAKREQTAQIKLEKAAAAADKPSQPKKANLAAQSKKIAAQLEGLAMLEKMLRQLVDAGLNAISAETLQQLESQSKQLGAYYLPGAQHGIWELIDLLQNEATKNSEGWYITLQRLLWLQNLVLRGGAYLRQRLEKPDLPPDINSPMEEWLGRVWQLQELRALNLLRENIDLLQLSFEVSYDRSKREFVDLGLWIIPGEADIWETRNYRPLKASAYIKEEDSENRLLSLPEAYLYPGSFNRRLRWESYTPREAETTDFQCIIESGTSIAQAVRQAKEYLKSPLSDSAPCLLVRAERLLNSANGPLLLDSAGQSLRLEDAPTRLATGGAALLEYLPQSELHDLAVLLRFDTLYAEGRLAAQPLALVGASGLTRLI